MKARSFLNEPEHFAETRRWLRYAEEDLCAAKTIVEQEGIPRHACWHSQQAAEKAIKAILVFLQVDFPRSHDLARLRNLVPESYETRSLKIGLAELSEWSVEARYPGDWPEAGRKDARRAIEVAQLVVSTAMRDLAGQGLQVESL